MQIGSDPTLDLCRERDTSADGWDCSEDLLRNLRDLAGNGRDPAELSAILYENLRKHAGGPQAREILAGIQMLAVRGESAGARLLGAMLEVAAPARRLLPLVRNMSSSRRLWLGRLREDPAPNRVMTDWIQRLDELGNACRQSLTDRGETVPPPCRKVGWEDPWGAMRHRIGALVTFAESGGNLADDDRSLLLGLLNLEVDAWQERISYLAGTIDPFRVAAITRVLPILSRADADIRDLRHLMGLVREKKDREAFTRSRLRALDVLEERELGALVQILAGDEILRPLSDLFAIQQTNPLPVPVLAHGAARVQALSAVLQSMGRRAATVDLVQACHMVIAAHNLGEVVLTIPVEILPDLEKALQEARLRPGCDRGPGSWSLGGVEILAGQLVIVLPEPDADLPAWPNFLPTFGDGDPLLVGTGITPEIKVDGAEDQEDQEDQEDRDSSDQGAAAMKNLVLTNIQSTSLVLGFLRNPKFVAIPGLVEAVATRTRNPRVIEVIAADRTLHTGFANRGVPLACLRSPVNVSVKALRKFIHVKYISKIDLKRMAQDRAGMRKEVIREIEKYLKALA